MNIETYPLFSVTALLVGEKLPPEAELDVSDLPTFFEWIVCLSVCLSELVTRAVWWYKSTFLFQNDPFKLKTGGVVDMKKVKDRNRDM